MKTSFLRSSFYAFFAIALFSLTFSSCVKEDVQIFEDQVENVVDQDIPENAQRIPLLLPTEITSQGEEALKNFLENAPTSELRKYHDDFIVREFLTEKGVIDQIQKEDLGGNSFSEMDLSSYLDAGDLRTLESKLDATKDSFQRACKWHCYDVYELVWKCRIIGIDQNGNIIEICISVWEYVGTICVWVCDTDPVPTTDAEPVPVGGN